ncbi:MAG: alpha/beta hydrolase family protein, partial [Gammaproteobacteria bacterium]|nr:alpha/beta hydrolase family protein [Gammaproteobacteria bacterium]
MTRIISLASTLILLLSPLGGIADSSREHRIERDLDRATIADGSLVRLDVGGGDFVAIHLVPQRLPARGAVLLLHDPWGNADSPEVTRPLRRGLAQAGWETLALQLPPA